MKFLKVVLLSLALAFSASIHAGGFFGVGGSLMAFDDGFDEVDPKNGFLRAGYAVNKHLEFGGEYSITLISDDLFGVDFDVDTIFIFIKGNLVLDGGTKLYAMFGHSDLTVTGSFGGFSLDVDDTSTGYGFGVQIPTDTNAYFSIDYISYFDENDFDGVPGSFDAHAINFGYLGYFD